MNSMDSAIEPISFPNLTAVFGVVPVESNTLSVTFVGSIVFHEIAPPLMAALLLLKVLDWILVTQLEFAHSVLIAPPSFTLAELLVNVFDEISAP